MRRAAASRTPEPARPSAIRRVWHSIWLRGPVVPTTDRDRAFVTIHTLVLHLRPVKLPARALRFTHTFGLGGSALVLISLLAVTGLLLTIGYRPAPDAAYASILGIERDVAFGSLVRGMHYWAANLLVIVSLLHMGRVLLTGGYHGPRQFNWVVGLGLLALVLASAFTGYLLPWDQLSYWAITIATGMLTYVPGLGGMLQAVARGGPDVGAATLVLYYTIHTSIVPALVVAALSFHFWRVRKAGGVVVPDDDTRPDESGTVMFVPHLLVREAALGLAVIAAVTVLGAAFGAPLGEAANPGMSPDPAKAPWYFMGFQELLIHVHPILAVVLIPLAVAVALVALPYVTRDDEPAGRWWLSPRGARSARLTATWSAVVTLAAIGADEFVGRRLPGLAGSLVAGVVPTLVLATGAAWGLRTVCRRFGLTRNETAQTIAIAGAVVLAVLTMVGVWLRGPGMTLNIGP